MNLQSIQALVISALIIVALTVLMITGKLSITAGLPPILLLGGLHINTATGNNSTTPPIQ